MTKLDRKEALLRQYDARNCTDARLYALAALRPSSSHAPLSHWSDQSFTKGSLSHGATPRRRYRPCFFKTTTQNVFDALVDFEGFQVSKCFTLGLGGLPLSAPLCPFSLEGAATMRTRGRKHATQLMLGCSKLLCLTGFTLLCCDSWCAWYILGFLEFKWTTALSLYLLRAATKLVYPFLCWLERVRVRVSILVLFLWYAF